MASLSINPQRCYAAVALCDTGNDIRLRGRECRSLALHDDDSDSATVSLWLARAICLSHPPHDRILIISLDVISRHR